MCVLQCIAESCSVLQCVAACCSCSVLQYVAVCSFEKMYRSYVAPGSDACVAVCPRCCSMLQHALSRRSITHMKVHHSYGNHVSRGRYSQNSSCDSIESMDLHMSDEVMDLDMSGIKSIEQQDDF